MPAAAPLDESALDAVCGGLNLSNQRESENIEDRRGWAFPLNPGSGEPANWFDNPRTRN
jgi:hypothetical protein